MSDELPYPLPVIDPQARKLWGDGLWSTEPDHRTWTDSRTQLRCAMVRNDTFGVWCGYVGVPRGHPLHGLSVNHRLSIPEELKLGSSGRDFGAIALMAELMGQADDGKLPLSLLLPAHGGINYAEISETGLWWFGFDCLHSSSDLIPAIPMARKGITYRHHDYVYGIVTRLAWAIESVKIITEDHHDQRTEPSPKDY